MNFYIVVRKIVSASFLSEYLAFSSYLLSLDKASSHYLDNVVESKYIFWAQWDTTTFFTYSAWAQRPYTLMDQNIQDCGILANERISKHLKKFWKTRTFGTLKSQIHFLSKTISCITCQWPSYHSGILVLICISFRLIDDKESILFRLPKIAFANRGLHSYRMWYILLLSFYCLFQFSEDNLSWRNVFLKDRL